MKRRNSAPCLTVFKTTLDAEKLLMCLVKRMELRNLFVVETDKVGPLNPRENGNIKQLGDLPGEPQAVNDGH